MPDASELFPILIAAAVAVGGLFAFVRARRVASRPLRLTLRSLAVLLAALCTVVAAALLFFAFRYTRHLPPAVSPDGAHLAITTYTVDNGTGVDPVEVTVRHTWFPYAHTVYTGPSKYDPAAPEPEVRWQDDTHLQVRFNTYVDSPNTTATQQTCAAETAGIHILCEQTRVHTRP